MERFDSLKVIIWLITVIIVIEAIMLAVIMRPSTFFEWATIAIIVVLLLYLVRLSLGLLSELKDKHLKNNK